MEVVNRRRFFLTPLALSALRAQEGPPQPDEVERMTAGPAPAIAVCQVGYRPEARKHIVVRHEMARKFTMTDIGSGPRFQIERPLKSVMSDFGPAMLLGAAK